MYMILSFSTGRYTDAILLSATSARMRVVVQGQEDTLELCRTGSQWISDGGFPVEIQSLVAADEAAAGVWPAALTRAIGAAS